jgi:putative membrane protein
MTISDPNLKKLVWTVAILIPVVVTILGYLPGLEMSDEMKEAMYILPKMNAFLNGTAFLVLIAAWIAIMNKNVALHKKLTTTAVVLSVMFLLSYITFHFTMPSTKYCGEGVMRWIYFFILITHILLSTIIVPLVLFTYARGHMMQIEKHRKIAKITWPLWLYVTATGVIVYLMISPCYG